MKTLMLFLLVLVAFSSNAYVSITGRITSDSTCKSDDLFVIFLEDQEFKNKYMYQVSVPENGTYEFIVLPGKYSIEAVSKEGCTFIYNKIHVKRKNGKLVQNIKLRRNR